MGTKRRQGKQVLKKGKKSMAKACSCLLIFRHDKGKQGKTNVKPTRKVSHKHGEHVIDLDLDLKTFEILIFPPCFSSNF